MAPDTADIYNMMLKKKKKTSHTGLSLFLGALSFFVCYFLILEPVRETGNVCSGQGIIACPYVFIFSLMIGFIVIIVARGVLSY